MQKIHNVCLYSSTSFFKRNKQVYQRNNKEHGENFHLFLSFILKADLMWLAYILAICMYILYIYTYIYICAELITGRAFGSKIFQSESADFMYDTESKFYSSEKRKCMLGELEKIFRRSWHLY